MSPGLASGRPSQWQPAGRPSQSVKESDPWRGEIAGGGKRSEVLGSDQRWRGAVAGGGKRLQVEGSDLRWRGAIAGGGSNRRCRGAIAGEGERSQFSVCISLSAGGLQVASVSGGLIQPGPVRVRVTVSRPNQPGRLCRASRSRPPTRRHPNQPSTSNLKTRMALSRVA